MRIRKDGKRYVQDRSAQDFPFQPRDPAEAIKTETMQYLDQLERFAPRWKHGDGVPVKTVKAALRNLVEFLERNR